jgi:hypothetical protein
LSRNSLAVVSCTIIWDLSVATQNVLDLDNARPASNVQTPVRPTWSLLSFAFGGLGLVQVVRKPVIYLYPPSRLPDATVELLLVSSWSFSAIYPLPQTAISGERQIAAQLLTWTVEAELDGRPVNKTSGVGVAYRIFGFSSANSHLITPDAPRATTPVVEVIERLIHPAVSGPGGFNSSPDRQNPELPRRDTQGTHTTR